MSRPEQPCRREPLWALLLSLIAAATIAGCSSVFSELPKDLGGLPEGAPARSETAPVYPHVHEMPPKRSTAVLTVEERKKLEAELAAARDGKPPQEAGAKAR
jgi:hypothetical protein